MGAAAYNRGSVAIARSIQRDFAERGGDRKRIREMLERAEYRTVELEEFCLNVQSLYWDSVDSDTAGGLLKGELHSSYQKKKDRKKFKAMLDECVAAHREWVDSDHRESVSHSQVCLRKARAWWAVMTYLGVGGYHLPFHVPANL